MVLEYRAEWTYGAGSPGVSVFHGRSSALDPDQLAADDLSSRVGQFFAALNVVLPQEVTITFSTEVLDLNTTTGELEGVLNVTPPGSVVGLNTSVHAAPAGGRIAWTTPAIVAGRRLRGATFLVPMASNTYDSNGSLTTAAIGDLEGAAADYWDTGVFTSCQPSVWSRTHGIQADITGHQVPDRVAILRSRRD